MDTAYDHIQEETYPEDPTQQQAAKDSAKQTAGNFTNEVQDAYKAISNSLWAARLGGFLGTVKKQGEQYYDGASKQYQTASASASAGITNLMQHTRNLSKEAGEASASATGTAPNEGASVEAHPDRPDSLPADIVKEAEGMLSRFRSEAAKRLKDIEKAEDAADEALLRYGTNIRNFLREAVTIAPPVEGSEDAQKGKVLFESKDSSGKKVVHATRFDAQLHVIHSSLDSFMKDPVSPEWDGWKKDFDVEKKTDAIAKDLEKHAELRTAMEKCVPEKVEYGAFWCRYYFLRHVIETEEQRRREMLKASAQKEDEEVGWDEDSDSEAEPSATTPNATKPTNKSATSLAASKETLKPATDESETLKPAQPRRSNDEKSVADSDASYDLVSGATSRAPGSPQDKKKAAAEESDEEDWE